MMIFGSGNTEYYTQILFKPSYAVQARELSQIQSMQSRMLKRVCDFFFIEGSELTPSGNGLPMSQQLHKIK
jgi:hypothetical protein